MSTTVIHGRDEINGSNDPVNLTDNKLHIAQFVWDTNTLSWIRQTGSSGTGTDVTVTNFPSVQNVDQAARKMLIDSVNPNAIYIGQAAIGSGTSSPAWRIQKITITGPNTDISWSGSNFTAVWDDRASLSYT